MNLLRIEFLEPLSKKNEEILRSVFSLIQISYKERAKEGISFATLDYTYDEYLEELRKGRNVFFLAFDTTGVLCGVCRLELNGNHGLVENFAVLPEAQGKHVGSELLQEIKRYSQEQKLSYLVSFTAVNAKSSVRCHTKNGYHIITKFTSGRGYESYGFRCQVCHHFLWSYGWFCYFRYSLSCLKRSICYLFT